MLRSDYGLMIERVLGNVLALISGHPLIAKVC